MMLFHDKLFSREALDKMRSPERLDVLLHITTPIGWMALAAVMLLLVGIILWSIFGAFTVKADGYGLIMDAGGIRRYVAKTSGNVTALDISRGKKVKKGDVLGKVTQVFDNNEVDYIRNSIELGGSYYDVEQRVNQYAAKKNSIAVVENIVSPYTGTIDAVMTDVGEYVNAGEELFWIRRDEDRDDLNGIMYVSVEMGKRLEPGMSMQLAPNGTDTSQSGSLLAVVRTVSQYPVNQQEMLHKLGNVQLVQTILQACGGTTVAVTFDLVKNPKDSSGYLWTSVVGDHKPITPGTYVTGSVIVDRKPPIEKVFYKISQWLRNR